MADEIKIRKTPYFSFIIDPEDGTPEDKWVVWKLSYGYNAIAKIENAIGLDLKKIAAWKDISSGKHFPTIVWGGLEKFNPEVTLDEVLEVLNPEAQRKLSDAIFELMFPGVREAYEKSLKEAGTSPNAPAGTPSS